MAKLVLLLDDVAINEYRLDKKRITIGRNPDNDILVDDPVVSSRHAIITTNQNALMTELLDVFFEDLNSTNGSRVNKMAPKKHQKLRQGDIIQVGRSLLRFDSEQDEVIDATAIYIPDDDVD